MQRHQFFRSLVPLSMAAALTATSPLLAAQRTEKLFFIQRNKNANEIHYDARVTRDGLLDQKHPIDAYWLREDGSRAPIKWVQKPAFGYDVEPGPGGTYTMRLEALKRRPLTLVRVEGRWRARLVIAGTPAYLQRIYVMSDDSGLMPKVLHVDVLGENVKTGGAVRERLLPR